MNDLAAVTNTELQNIHARMRIKAPEYAEHFDAALESALRYPPDPNRPLEPYLTRLAKHAFLNATRNKREVSLDGIATRPEIETEAYESLSVLADPTAAQEFDAVEKEHVPLTNLCWLELARQNLIAKQLFDARNKYGRSERTAWQRRQHILELCVRLAEEDEYDRRPGEVLHWVRERLEANGVVVEIQTLANDISAIREIVRQALRQH